MPGGIAARLNSTLEWRDGTLLMELAEEEESRPGTTQQRSCVRRQDARGPLRRCGRCPSNLDDADAGRRRSEAIGEIGVSIS